MQHAPKKTPQTAIVFHIFLIILAALLATQAPAWGKPVTLRLVCADRPDTVVSEVETSEEKKPKEEDVIGKKASREKLVGWMRGISLDGQDAFKITYKGAFLKHSATITAELAEGEHRIEPGAHRFWVRDDRLESQDPDLRAAGDGLDILCYPVTFAGVDASVVRKRPLKLRSIPLNLRVRWAGVTIIPAFKTFLDIKNGQIAGVFKDPVIVETFDLLKLYMVSNREGTPYEVSPTGQAFRVTREGIQLEDSKSAQTAATGVFVENRFQIGIPAYVFPLQVTTRLQHKVGVKVYGFSGETQILAKKEMASGFQGFYSQEGSQVKVGHGLPSEPIPIEGDVAAYPYRRIQVDARDAGAAEPRAFAASWKRQSFQAGEFLEIRLHYLDSQDAATLAPAEVAVFLRIRPVLTQEGAVDYPGFEHYPDVGKPLPPELWQRLLCRQVPGQPIYRVRIHARPTNIYPFRIVVDRSGKASPESLLAADGHLSISSPEHPGTLSLFTDSRRKAYEAGELLEFNVVLKTRSPLSGVLEVELQEDSASHVLVRKEVASQGAGSHTFTFRLLPETTAALASGAYRLRARLGPYTSNAHEIILRQPMPETHFPIFHYIWGAGPLGATITRAKNPKMWEFELRRNIGRLAHQNINTWCRASHENFYDLRESDTFGAVVEQVMNEDLGLPASELAYTPTNFEILNDEMIRHGLQVLPMPYTGRFGWLSLRHTIPEDRMYERRKAALVAQDFRRFPTWAGLVSPVDHIGVLGNSETGDERWFERDRLLLKNFKARYGHDIPREDQVRKWFHGDSALQARLAETETQWMRWMDTVNALLPGMQREIREAVSDFRPQVPIGTMTFNSYSALWGEFISKQHSEMSFNVNTVSRGDYGRLFPLEDIVETLLGRVTGPRQEQWRLIGDGANVGRTNAKVQFFKSLMSRIDALGFFNYSTEYELGMQPNDWSYDECGEFTRWLKEYGDWYQRLELQAPIGVYLSYLDSAHEVGGARDFGVTLFLVRGALYELARAHRLAQVLDEERVRQGDLQRCRVLILPGVQFMPEDVRSAFEAFVQAGGVVLADEDTRVEIAGATRISKHFRTMLYPYIKIGCQYDGNRIFWEAYKRTRGEVVKLNQILETLSPPFADAASSRILTSALRHGDARYVFVVNDELPFWAESYSMGAQEFTLPCKTQVRIRDTEATIYSVLEGRVVDGPSSGGLRTLDVDLEFGPAHIYALLPRPIAGLRLAASESVRPGQTVQVSAEILDASGQVLRAAAPLELKVLDPSGRVHYHLYRTTHSDGFRELLPVGANAPSGLWRVEAQERLAGWKSVAEFTVGGPAAPLQAVEAGDVIVAEGQHIRQFLHNLKNNPDGLWIVLSADQFMRLSPLASRLAEGLSRHGIPIQVKRLDEAGVVEAHGRITDSLARITWNDPRPATHLRHHVLLLGLEGDHQLIEEICDTPLLARRFTHNYPGSGRALIQMVHSPFAASFNALLILSSDDAGLVKGVESIIEPDRLGEQPSLLRTASAEPSPASLRPGTTGEPLPLPNRILEQEGLPVSAIAFSPEGDYFAIGCDWYFSNLFLFERSGRLLWKQKLGRKEVQQIVLSRGGEKVCAVTDQGTYLLDRSGQILWRLRQPAVMNAEGDLLFSAGAELTLALRPDGSHLWFEDPWQEETDPWRMNDANNLYDITFLDDGKTVVLRNGSFIEYRDAATNRVLQKFQPRLVTETDPDTRSTEPGLDLLRVQPTRDGNWLAFLGAPPISPDDPYASFQKRDFLAYVCGRDGRICQKGFLAPPSYSTYRGNDDFWLGRDGSLYVLGKDTVHRVLPEGRAAWNFCLEGPLVSGGALSPDGSRLALASWNNQVAILDTTTGRPLWKHRIDSGAELAFSPDGQMLVAGGKTGVIRGLSLDGKVLFQFDLRKDSFIPNIEEFWASHDRAVSDLRYGLSPPWQESVRRNVPLSANLLTTPPVPFALRESLQLSVPGEKFGTYLFTLRYRAREGKGSFRVSIREQNVKEDLEELRSGAFEARTFSSELNWIFKLSDAPAQIHLELDKPPSDPEIGLELLSLQKLEYSSDNYCYHRGAYSQGKTQEVMDHAPVNPAIYHMLWGSHSTVLADPFYLMDGRVFKKQPELEDGWWFGGGGASDQARHKITPCAMDIEFPEPRPVSHIALFHDEGSEPAERVCFQAWVQAKDVRKDKTELEERQILPGYWRTVGKGRWNKDAFQLFKFENLITEKIRFWYLRGPCTINEVEIYGPLQATTSDWFDNAWLARIPVKLPKAAEMAEVEFMPLGLTQPDGADLRVVGPLGTEVPYVIKHLNPAGTSALVFKSEGFTGNFFIYLGNDEAMAPAYDWHPQGGIWIESYVRPETIDGRNTREVYNEKIMNMTFDVSKARALETRKNLEAEGKAFKGMHIGFVRAVGFDALPNAITRYTFTMCFEKPARLAFRATVSSDEVASLLKVNDQVVFGGWNAFEPGKAPAWAVAPGKFWGDTEIEAGVHRFEFTFAGHAHFVDLPLTFRPAEGRSDRHPILSRDTCFPGARRLLPERIQLQENLDLGLFFLSRARKFVQQQRLFDAQEMLLFAGKSSKDPQVRTEARQLATEVNQLVWNTNWAMFHRNPARTGASPLVAGPDQKELPADPHPFQRVSYRETFDEQFESGIAATDIGTFFGTCFNHIRKAGGWWLATSGIIRGTPLVYGQRVYCGSMDGNLYCLTAALGELVWKFPTGDGIASSPFLVDDRLIFGGLDGYLYCLDPVEGVALWKYRTGGWIEGSPATDGENVFIGSYDDGLHAVNLQTGRGIWKFSADGDIVGSPCVAGGVVYVGADDSHVYAVKTSDGTLVWKTKLGGFLPSSPALAHGILVIGSEDDHVYALDAATGALRWSCLTGDDVEASPVIVGNEVYVPSNDNHLYIVRLSDGALLAKNPFTLHPGGELPRTRSFRCPPAYHRESLWLGGTLDIKSGQLQRWER